MKPARERFFPSSTPRAGSGPTFTNQDSLNTGGRLRNQNAVILSELQNTGMDRPPTQMAFTALMRRTSANALPLGSSGNIMRPGTTEPRVREDHGLNTGVENRVIAPTPKKFNNILPPFALRDGTLGSNSLDSSRDDHSSRSQDIPPEERQEEGFKYPFPKKMNQRVPPQPEVSHYPPKLLPRRSEPSSVMLNNYAEQDGSDMPPSHRNQKRKRGLDEVDDSGFMEADIKRFKSSELEEDDKMSHQESSPHLERPNSTSSSAVGSYRHRSNTIVGNTPPMQHSQVEHQEPLGSNNETHGGLPRRKLSEPTGLDKLLGPGGNNILDMRSDKYEASFKKWSECSVEEWKAGAEEISGRFTRILNFAKDHLDKKVKNYSDLNAVLDSHSEILRERSETMDLARQKVVKNGANVLG